MRAHHEIENSRNVSEFKVQAKFFTGNAKNQTYNDEAARTILSPNSEAKKQKLLRFIRDSS